MYQEVPWLLVGRVPLSGRQTFVDSESLADLESARARCGIDGLAEHVFPGHRTAIVFAILHHSCLV